MKQIKIYLVAIFLIIINLACEKDEIFEPVRYECDFDFLDTSDIHPNADIYQNILDENRRAGLIGAIVLVKDQHGLWIGSSGKSDLASGIDMQPCNRFPIASITKVFTAAAIFRYVDAGLISLDDPVRQWLKEDIVSKLANTDQATIRQLLNHTSGIPDYYSLQYQLDILNEEYNNWQHEDILEYAYGLQSTGSPGSSYYYSNSNFLLLGLILEEVSGLSLDRVYEENIFNPLNLTSAYFGKEDPLPGDEVKGYADLYGNDQFVESEFLYKDELGTGDGGIVINIKDLLVFFESLMNGSLISNESLNQMTDWFDLPGDWGYDKVGHFHNGLGLMKFTTSQGDAVGHTGSIFGFFTIAQYFPEQDAAFILLSNTASYDNEPKYDIYHQSLDVMFD